jgi:hypothetical protein
VAILLQSVGRGIVLHGLLAQITAVIIAFLLIVVGAAPFGTTILGWVAVAQIRRSAGKLHGLWLAVFDGLLFPLLVLDAVVWIFVGLVLTFLHLRIQVGAELLLFLVPLIAIPSAVILDILIIRRVWRAVNKGSAGVPPADSSWRRGDESPTDNPESQSLLTSAATRKMSGAGKVVAIGCAVVALVGFLFVILVAVSFFWLKHAKVDEVKQIQAQHQAVDMAQMEADKAKTAAGQNFSFGPVVERVMEETTAPDWNWFDLDTGRSVSARAMATNEDDAANDEWRRTHGVDVGSTILGTNRGLVSVDLVAVPVNERLWDLDETDVIIALINESRPTEKFTPLLVRAKEPPATFVFKTREGGMGILQITGFTENPRGVKIRYKLVQPRGSVTHTYVIEKGDTVARIAKQFGMSLAELKALNPELNPGRIKIGQKVAVYGNPPAKAPSEPSSNQQIDSSFAFSPVVERVVAAGEANSDGIMFVNFEQNEIMPSPFTLEANPGDATLFRHTTKIDEWIEATGADMALRLQAANWSCDPLGARLIFHHDQAGADFFEQASPEEVGSVLANPKAHAAYTVSLGTRVSAYPAIGNYLFKTRGGAMGVLQIAGFTNNSNGVKLRYKLVQSLATNKIQTPSVANSADGQTRRTYSSFDLPATADQTMPSGMINFQNVPLEQLLKIYGALSGRTAVHGNLPTLSITIRSATPLNRIETLQLFDTVLAQNGIAVVLSGDKAVKAVPVATVAEENPPEITLPWTQLPDSSSPMSRTVLLKNVRAAEVIPMLAPFAKVPHSLVTIQDKNILIIRDFSSSVRQQLKLLETLEQKSESSPENSSPR